MKQIARWNLKMLLGTASIEAVSITKNVIRSVMEILRATGFVPVVGAFDSFFPSSKPATPLRDSSFEIQREIKNTATLERQTLTAARVCNGELVTLSNFKRYHGGRGEYYLHKYCSSYEILVECLPE